MTTDMTQPLRWTYESRVVGDMTTDMTQPLRWTYETRVVCDMMTTTDMTQPLDGHMKVELLVT